MPAIAEKHDCLGGQVFRYSHTTEGWFFRVYEKEKRRYRIGKVEGANTLEDAETSAYKVLLSFQTTEVIKKERKEKRTQHTFDLLAQDFHDWETGKVEAGLKDEYNANKRRTSIKWMLSYLKQKSITSVSQIRLLTFNDYPLFRQGRKKLTIKTELSDIGVFFRSFLQPRGHVTNELVLDKNFLPRIIISDEDLDANPAITPNDYKVINNFMRHDWKKDMGNHRRSVYIREYFWCYVHLLKNSGCRPSEMLRLRRKDIEITNEPRWSETNQKWEDNYKLKLHIRKSKTGKRRDVLCRSNAANRLMGWLSFQNEYLQGFKPKQEALIFGKAEDLLEKTYSYCYLSARWREVIENCSLMLEGNRFSEQGYTLYSLRSTFIEDCITDGLDVYLVARLVGNSVDVIQRHYDRHDVLKRAGEIQALPIGVTKPPKPKVISLGEL